MTSTNRPMISLRPKSFGVNTAATRAFAQLRRIGLGDDPADHDGDIRGVGRGARRESPGTSSMWNPRDRDTDKVDVFGHGCGDDLLRVSRMP